MKLHIKNLPVLILTPLLAVHWLMAMEPPVIVPPDETGEPAAMRVVWATEPGLRYQLQESTSLEEWDWTTVAGFPAEAEALAQQHAFEIEGARRFFRVAELDEQPPEIVSLSPLHEGFGVGRFSAVTVVLSDRTGVDPNSIQLSIGDRGGMTLSHPALSFEDGVLLFDLGGDAALGTHGELVDCRLTVADPLGNLATYDWVFELEEPIVVVDDLFVFGSPDALRAGQQLAALPAAVAARFGGPVRMGDPPAEWTLESVDVASLVVAYTSEETPNLFFAGQKVTNLAPAHEEEIFYREVTAVAVDVVAKRITLQTTALELPDIISDGSFTFGDDAAELEFDENGNLVAMRTLVVKLPSLGGDLSGKTIYYFKDANKEIHFRLDEARAWFHPSMTFSLKNKWFKVDKFLAKAEGRVDVALIPRLEIDGAYFHTASKELWNKSIWVWTSVGIVPVGVQVKTSITAKAWIDVDGQATFTGGFRQTASMGVQGSYKRGASPSVKWDRWFTVDPMDRIPFTYTLDGQGRAEVSVIPQIDIRLYGVGGAYLNIDPRLNLSGSASFTNGTLNHGHWLLGAYADLNAGLSLIGFNNNQLHRLASTRLFTHEWGQSYTAAPQPVLAITRQPESQSARIGDSVAFSILAEGGSDLRYRWYHNDMLLPFSGNAFRFNVASGGYAGQFQARVSDSSGSLDSEIATLSIVTEGVTGPSPAGFALIPGGWFTMGRTSGDTDSDAPPVNVYVSEFHLARHEVSEGVWEQVSDWAQTNGYTDLGSGGYSERGNHPANSVTWWEAVKWCNARSEMEGLNPVYRVNGEVMRSGSTHPVADWNADGYRLPTEAEWEKAARGGVGDFRFPWGNDITHGHANYRSLAVFDYDTSATRGLHPDFETHFWPCTAPVGSFAANNYGLHDVTGNVLEWCWDWYSESAYVDQANDPRGSPTGSEKLVRGGSWDNHAFWARSASRGMYAPDVSTGTVGFRLARSSVLSRSSFPTPAGFALISDSSWKCHQTEQSGWQNVGLDDSGWANAIVLTVPDLYPYPPTAFIPGTRGQHIWHAGLPGTAYFRKTFIIPGMPQSSQAIVRVDDAYDFYVNGTLVGSKHTLLPTDAQTYDITAYLRQGVNVFAIKGWDLGGHEAVLFDANVNFVE